METTQNKPFFRQRFNIIADDELRTTLSDALPAMFILTDPRICSTMQRYAKLLRGNLAISEDGTVFLYRHAPRPTRDSFARALRLFIDKNRELQNTAHGFKSMCLDEDEEELNYVLKAYQQTHPRQYTSAAPEAKYEIVPRTPIVKNLQKEIDADEALWNAIESSPDVLDAFAMA